MSALRLIVISYSEGGIKINEKREPRIIFIFVLNYLV
jgi:hypothetical protein